MVGLQWDKVAWKAILAVGFGNPCYSSQDWMILMAPREASLKYKVSNNITSPRNGLSA